jgi:UDP-N-acetylglucosamine 3-dehydrogenase
VNDLTSGRLYSLRVDRQPLRGIIAGLGVMGMNHLRILGSRPDVEVVAVVEPDEGRRRRVAASHAKMASYAELPAALASVQADFVCLATPIATLPPLAHQVLDSGIPVVVEKPMAPDEAQGLELVRHAEDAGLFLGVGYVERFNPAVALLKRKIEEGAIGRVYEVHARRLSPSPGRNWASGVSLDLAIHDVDVMHYLLGSGVSRVFAETARRNHDRGEDLVCASLRFENGVTAIIEANWLTPTKVRQLTVTGENGMFTLDYLTQDLVLQSSPRESVDWEALEIMRGVAEGDTIRFGLLRREPLVVQWDGFLAALRDALVAPVDGWAGLSALSVAFAMQQAGETHEVVEPAYPLVVAGAPGG